ncbi:hypothetical protein Q8F55_006369 [Vanrija albida]|uniref:Uncharacterized protein n=1 Tax=Vanrija albida TaxID=181172 RepID=A0ABR3PXQ9_9TREE
MTQPAQSPPQPQPQPPAYRPPHIANLTALEGGRAQPNPLLPPGPNGTVFGLTPDQLGARIAALEASPIVRLGAFFDRFDPPPRAPPPPPRDAALEERMGNLFIARGADPAQVTPHMPELAAVMAQNAALSNQLAHERAYKAHREAWHAANPRRGVFGTRPATPPLPPLPEEALTDPQGLLEHMVHGAGLLQAPVPGCKYCVPVAQMREGMARQYEDHQAGLRRRREERWRQRVGEWRARYGREYDHARAAGVQDRFGEGWEYLEGGAAWDALQAEEERRAPRYSSD